MNVNDYGRSDVRSVSVPFVMWHVESGGFGRFMWRQRWALDARPLSPWGRRPFGASFPPALPTIMNYL